jgi:UDP-N-acetylglucosamine 2-epimerase (non-hydrolysing)
MKRRIKILCVVGARPNFIKIAPLFEEFKRYKTIKPILVHTGQHYDFEMSQVFFQELKIPKPDYNLEVGSGTHAWQTAKIMEKLEPVLLKENPNLVTVVGDVNSTLAGALAAAKLHIPVAHIEAGLRSYDKTMPEEINRVLTDHISTLLFCPTKTAIKNLKKEGIKKGVYNVGDITYDTFLKYIGIAQTKSQILKKLNLKPKSYFLLTFHRPSNVDNLGNLKNILEAIGESGEKVVFPIHPRTKKRLRKLKHLNICKLTNLQFIGPVGYIDMLCLEKNAKKIITDSGGVQKEAYWVKVPCITLRNTTEWVETVKNGWNILVATNEKKIMKAIRSFNPKRKQYKYFGNGKATKKIVKILKFKFNGK